MTCGSRTKKWYIRRLITYCMSKRPSMVPFAQNLSWSGCLCLCVLCLLCEFAVSVKHWAVSCSLVCAHADSKRLQSHSQWLHKHWPPAWDVIFSGSTSFSTDVMVQVWHFRQLMTCIDLHLCVEWNTYCAVSRTRMFFEIFTYLYWINLENANKALLTRWGIWILKLGHLWPVQQHMYQ